jgi:hypothetical protein
MRRSSPYSPAFRRRFRRLDAESLESRELLVASPLGVELRINTQTGNSQGDPSIAMDADGDYVVTWESNAQDGSGYGIYAQRYNAAGVPQGNEFRANQTTQLSQSFPAVAMDADGDFVITWQSDNQDGSSHAVYAQRYNAAGVAQGGEFRVNTFTNNSQSSPAVAMDGDGDFVIAWQSFGQDGSNFGIYARRYNAAGTAQGGEFRVNNYTNSAQANPSVAMDADGDFIIAYQSNVQDGNSMGVYARRYNAAGTAQGGEFRVNTQTVGSQFWPGVDMDSDGDFVVAWHSYGQDGSSYGIYAQRYNAAAAPQGSEFRVNTNTTNSQTKPSVALDEDGDFTITWNSLGQDGSSYGVYAQTYSAAGVPQQPEFLVNTYTAGNQGDPVIAMQANGDFVVAWHSDLQDGSGFGIYAQQFTHDTPPPAEPAVATFLSSASNIGAAEPLTLQSNSTASPGVADGGASIPSGLASSDTNGESTVTPAGTFERRDRPDVVAGAVARLVEYLAERNTPRTRVTQPTTVAIGDDWALDDELLDAILGSRLS